MKLPLKIDGWRILDADGNLIAKTAYTPEEDNQFLQEQTIVLAVNSHDALVRVLEAAKDAMRVAWEWDEGLQFSELAEAVAAAERMLKGVSG